MKWNAKGERAARVLRVMQCNVMACDATQKANEQRESEGESLRAQRRDELAAVDRKVMEWNEMG